MRRKRIKSQLNSDLTRSIWLGRMIPNLIGEIHFLVNQVVKGKDQPRITSNTESKSKGIKWIERRSTDEMKQV